MFDEDGKAIRPSADFQGNGGWFTFFGKARRADIFVSWLSEIALFWRTRLKAKSAQPITYEIYYPDLSWLHWELQSTLALAGCISFILSLRTLSSERLSGNEFVAKLNTSVLIESMLWREICRIANRPVMLNTIPAIQITAKLLVRIRCEDIIIWPITEQYFLNR